MTIQEQLTQDLATNMKAGNAAKTGVVRLLRGALKNEEIKAGHPLSEAEALKVFQREAKQRRDSIEQYVAGGRPELAEIEQAELDIIQEYLPASLSEDELRAIVEEVVTAQGVTTPAQMGAVIGAVMARVGARAEGGTVSKLVRERLGA